MGDGNYFWVMFSVLQLLMFGFSDENRCFVFFCFFFLFADKCAEVHSSVQKDAFKETTELDLSRKWEFKGNDLHLLLLHLLVEVHELFVVEADELVEQPERCARRHLKR